MGRTEWEEFTSHCVTGTIPRLSLGEVRTMYGPNILICGHLESSASLGCDGYDVVLINTTQVV